ncbi:MAG: SIS domain-containing protein, partial [Bacteroidota bacterium]
MSDYRKYAKEVFEIEAKAVSDLAQSLTTDFNKAVDAILKSAGRLVVCGVGKSGIIGRKIAATLASTGTPSLFIHPTEAFHGDLGMITKDDICLAISYSGETEELLKIIPFIKHN